MRKYPLKLFNPFIIANNNIYSTLKLKRKLDWCLEMESRYHMYLKFSTNVFMVESYVSLCHQVLLIITFFLSTSMCVERFASYIVPRFQTSSVLCFPPYPWLLEDFEGSQLLLNTHSGVSLQTCPWRKTFYFALHSVLCKKLLVSAESKSEFMFICPVLLGKK